MINLCRFSNLRKFNFATGLILKLFYNSKRRVKGKSLKSKFFDVNLKFEIQSAEIQSAQNLWLKMNQRELSQDRKYFTDLENQLRLVKDGNEIYR